MTSRRAALIAPVTGGSWLNLVERQAIDLTFARAYQP